MVHYKDYIFPIYCACRQNICNPFKTIYEWKVLKNCNRKLNINILFFNLKKSNGDTGGTANNENNE